MRTFQDLKLPPGEVVFVDSVHEGVARLLLGETGKRVRTITADSLPAEARKEGIYLRVEPNGSVTRDETKEKAAEAETTSLMEDVFGEPPPQ
jgi:hypothetical protein